MPSSVGAEGDFLIDFHQTESPSPPSTPFPFLLNGSQLDVSGVMTPEAEVEERIWTPEVIFRVTTLSLVMLLTLVGNVSLICVIACHQSLKRKRVSVFLLNLAVGDLMVCIVTMTTEILFVAFGQWVLGAIACKVIVYGQIVTLASTTFLLTAMSIDRYQVLVRPLQSLRGAPRVWPKMLASWLLALAFASPQLFIFVEVQEPRGGPSAASGGGALRVIATCKSAGYTAEWQRKVYFSFMTTYILLVPTAVMSFCYFSIIKVVWMRSGGEDIDTPKIHFITSRRCPAVAASGPPADDDLPSMVPLCNEEFRPRAPSRVSIPPKLVLASKRNVIKMTLSVIVGFVVCWTPYFVISLVRIFSNYRIQLVHALSVSEILALVHSALNPILYMFFSASALRALCWNFRRSGVNRKRKRKLDKLSPDTSNGTDAKALQRNNRLAAEADKRSQRDRQRVDRQRVDRQRDWRSVAMCTPRSLCSRRINQCFGPIDPAARKPTSLDRRMLSHQVERLRSERRSASTAKGPSRMSLTPIDFMNRNQLNVSSA